MILYNVLGIILVIIGFLILKFFPDVGSYQTKSFTMTGIFIGIVLIIVGIVLAIFG